MPARDQQEVSENVKTFVIQRRRDVTFPSQHFNRLLRQKMHFNRTWEDPLYKDAIFTLSIPHHTEISPRDDIGDIVHHYFSDDRIKDMTRISALQFKNVLQTMAPTVAEPDAELPPSTTPYMEYAWANAYTTLAPPGNDLRGTWVNAPNFLEKWNATSELRYALWLNQIALTMSVVSGFPQNWYWNTNYSTSPLSGYTSVRKPDLVLLRYGSKEITWKNVMAIAEIKDSNSVRSEEDVLIQLAGKMAIIYAFQDNRIAVHGLAFCGTDMCYVRYDRGGILRSAWMKIHNSFDELSRIIAGLCLGDEEGLGLDTDITSVTLSAPRRTIWSPLNGGTSYEIKGTLFISDELFGLGTVVWRVALVRESGHGVVKSYWHDPKCKFTEGQILQLIRPASNSGSDAYPLTCIPELVQEYVRCPNRNSQSDEDLQDGEKLDTLLLQASTRYWREYVPGLDSPNKYGPFWQERIHLHLITRSQGEARPLWQFTSREELFSALIDVVRVLEYVSSKFNMVHTDINFCTIYISERLNGTPPEDLLDVQLGTGCLGDWVNAQWDGDGRHANDIMPSPSPVAPLYYDRLMQLTKSAHTTPRIPPVIPSPPSHSSLPSPAGPSSLPIEKAVEYHAGENHESLRKVLEKSSHMVFASLEILSPYHHRQRPYHDLESVFLTMLTMAIIFMGPGVKRRDSYNYESLGLNRWWNPRGVKDAYDWRSDVFLNKGSFQAKVLDFISDYFSPFRALLLELYDVIFAHQRLADVVGVREPVNDSPATHSAMLAILEKLKLKAREIERRSPPPDAQRYVGSKDHPTRRKPNDSDRDPGDGQDSSSKSAGKKHADGSKGNKQGSASTSRTGNARTVMAGDQDVPTADVTTKVGAQPLASNSGPHSDIFQLERVGNYSFKDMPDWLKVRRSESAMVHMDSQSLLSNSSFLDDEETSMDMFQLCGMMQGTGPRDFGADSLAPDTYAGTVSGELALLASPDLYNWEAEDDDPYSTAEYYYLPEPGEERPASADSLRSVQDTSASNIHSTAMTTSPGLISSPAPATSSEHEIVSRQSGRPALPSSQQAQGRELELPAAGSKAVSTRSAAKKRAGEGQPRTGKNVKKVKTG